MNQRESESVTIFDVARAAGVSYATVSRVLNNKDHVKPEKRQAVLEAAARLGYVANSQARSLAGGPSRIVGLLVQDLGASYTGEIIRGIDAELEAAGYDLILYTTHRRKAKESAYVDAIARGLADGLLLILPRSPGAYLETLRRRHYPYVLIDHQGIGDYARSVGATNWQGAYDATRYLIGLGHRRIGFISGAMELGCSVDRLAGYQAALADHRLPPAPELIYTGDFHRLQGFAGAQALLTLPERPTAILASNDEMAFGAMEAARVNGLRIPDDISIVGFDDIPQASVVHPPLTTVRQPLEEMGRLATRMLLQLIADPQLHTGRIALPTELVTRQSCCPPARTPVAPTARS
jgi:LacI family transcriptional regulator